eukprot:TRINITY_DN4779_c2_g2_i1.p1 TRINITY_DN4779_c2_g2~~TRINITY_DN4779_c2_g2_i1.p1  ORF type:complete len:595 (-),score=181.25 TRINITY_DN4779_c2_g2_i1:407-2191(-)
MSETIVFQGFLTKCAIKSRRNWKKRYFRVFNNEITYSKSMGSSKVKGSLPVDAKSSVRSCDLKDFCFEYDSSDGRVMFAYASSTAELREWMKALKNLINKHKTIAEEEGKRMQRELELKEMGEVAAASKLAEEAKNAAEPEKVSFFDLIMGGKFRAKKLFSWGFNDVGQLGCGDKGVDKSSPEIVPALKRKNQAIKISCGTNHMGAISAQGLVFMWGSGKEGQMGTGQRLLNSARPFMIQAVRHMKVKDIVCAENHSLFLLENGEVLATGKGEFGQLGFGPERTQVFAPEPIPGLPPISSISANKFHSAFVGHNGHVFVCGKGGQGRLGTGSDTDIFSPQPVRSMHQKDISRVACGSNFTLYLSEARNELWQTGCLGYSESDFEANRETLDTPHLIDPIHFNDHTITDISCGVHHAAMVSGDEAYVWGTDTFLGTGNLKKSRVPKPIDRMDGVIVKQVACGGAHTLCISKGGRLFGWGNGARGQLGSGYFSDYTHPTPSKYIQDHYFDSIACGDQFCGGIMIPGHTPETKLLNCVQKFVARWRAKAETRKSEAQAKIDAELMSERDLEQQAELEQMLGQMHLLAESEGITIGGN